MINILAIDPGLATFGAVIVKTDGRNHDAWRADVFVSDLRASTFDIALADDRVRRTRELAAWIHRLTSGVDIDIVAAEAMSFPRGANAITAMCLAWGVVASFLEARQLIMVSAMPTHLRSHLAGPPPPVRGMTRARRKILTDQRERRAHAVAIDCVPSALRVINRIRPNGRQLHALDALVAFVWSMSTPLVRERLR